MTTVIATNIYDGTTVEFRSTTDAAKILHIARQNISEAIKGKRNTAGGYTWEVKGGELKGGRKKSNSIKPFEWVHFRGDVLTCFYDEDRNQYTRKIAYFNPKRRVLQIVYQWYTDEKPDLKLMWTRNRKRIQNGYKKCILVYDDFKSRRKKGKYWCRGELTVQLPTAENPSEKLLKYFAHIIASTIYQKAPLEAIEIESDGTNHLW